MKKSCKKIAAFTLSLAVIAGNAVTFLPNNSAMTAQASELSSDAQEGIVLPDDDDESNQDIIFPDYEYLDDDEWDGGLPDDNDGSQGIILPDDDGESGQDNTQDVEMKDKSYYDSETKTLHLKGYIRNSEDGSGIILPEGVERQEIITMVADEGTVLPENCSHFCEGMDQLSGIELQNADTSNVTDMSYMFYFPKSESERIFDHVVLSNFDTSKVTNMQGMFKNCKAPIYDIATFDTSNVTNMSEMFAGSGWYEGYGSYYYYENFREDVFHNVGIYLGLDTSKVTDMSGMFEDSIFKSINISTFDTSNVTDMSDMFKGCRLLGRLALGNLNTSKVTDMSGMFSNMVYEGYMLEREYLYSLDLSGFDTSNVTDMSHMFSYSYFQELDLSSFNTSKVTDMSYMFSSLDRLYKIDLSSFDTSNVTTMEGMFCGCNRLGSLDLSSFDTSKVTCMKDMFSYCRTIESLNLGSFDTSNVTDMSCMFSSCQAIEFLDFSNFDTSNVTDMSHMFDFYDYHHHYAYRYLGAISINSLDLSGLDTSNVTNMNGMFNGCYFLHELDISCFDTSKVSNMAEMFKECNNLETIIVGPKWSAESAETADNMFSYCQKLVGGEGTVYDWNHTGIEYAHVDGGEKDPGYLTYKAYTEVSTYYDAETKALHLKGYIRNSNDGSGMILPDGIEKSEVRHIVAEEGTVLPANCSHLCNGFINILSMDFSKADTSNVTDMSYMFMPSEETSDYYWYTCYGGIDVSNFDTSNVTTMKGMFKKCYTVPELDLSSFDTSNVTDMSEMFSYCGYTYYEGPKSLDLSSFDTSKVKDMSKMFYECEALEEIDLSSFDTSNVTDMSDMFSNCTGFLTLDLGNFDTSKVTTMKDMFYRCLDLRSVNISSFDTSNVTDMSGMFQWCCSLKKADLSSFNTSQVTDMSKMFYVCQSLKELNLSSFDTSNVTDMNSMFSCCAGLEKIDLSSFDTSNVTDMRDMLDNCRRLKSIDISSFDTRNVSNMYCMFNNDYALETIIVGNAWSTESVEKGNYMFSHCEKLVGGAGTVYDADHTGAEYAHADGGKKDPGYFTALESSTDNTIVIYIPEGTMDAINYLYEGIDDPAVKDCISAAKDMISKYISIKVF